MKVDAIEVDVRSYKGELYLSHDKIKDVKKCIKLTDALSLISRKSGIMLDIKEHLNTTTLVNCIEDFKGTIYISGTYSDIIKRIKESFPKVVALISVQNNKTIDEIPEFIDGVSIRYTILNKDLAENLHHRGMYIAAWTVNKKSKIKYLVDIGVDAIITDKPSFLFISDNKRTIYDMMEILFAIKKRKRL